MKKTGIYASLLALMAVTSAYAWNSVDYHQSTANPFPEEFTQECKSLQKADVPESLKLLTEMLAKYKDPQEQVELELTLAKIYGQRTGFVDPAKAVEHYEKALALHFDLPPAVLARTYTLYGNSYEQLHNGDKALENYLRGLAVCLSYELPAKMPNIPAVGTYETDAPPDSPLVKQLEDEHKKQMELRKQAMFERDMLMQRYFLIDGIKRVSKGDTGQIRRAAESVGKDKLQIESLVTLAMSPNERPL